MEMRDCSVDKYKELAEVQTPSAFVTLAWTNRGREMLPGLRAFKNLTELDLSNNHLTTPQPDLHQLRFLRKLSLSHNSLSTIHPLPQSLEHLVLSNNYIVTLEPVAMLKKLHTLDVAYNRLTSLAISESLPSLKCLYLSHNNLTSVSGLAQYPSLLELDLSNNPLRGSAELPAIQQSLIVAVRLPSEVSVEVQNWDFVPVEDGVFIRNEEKLKTLKVSRFLQMVKAKRKRQSKVLSSPNWGHSKTSSGSFPTSWVCTQQEFSPLSIDSSRLSVIARRSVGASLGSPASDPQNESLEQSLIISSKLDDHFRSSEDISAVFQDLIEFFQLDHGEEDFSFSVEKYERVAAIIKEKERERRTLVGACAALERRVKELEEGAMDQERVLMRLNDVESQLTAKTREQGAIYKLRKENATLTQRLETTGRIKDTLEGLQDANAKLTALLEEEKRKTAEAAYKLSELSFLSHQQLDPGKEDLFQVHNPLKDKTKGDAKACEIVRDTRRQVSFDASDSSSDYSFYRRERDGSVLINKRVGLYVEQLKNKVQRLKRKVQVLRDQRNRTSMQLQTLAKAVAEGVGTN